MHECTLLVRHFLDDQHGMKCSISLSRVSCCCYYFLLMKSRSCPHTFHMVWGASHFRGIAHMVVPLNLPHNSHGSRVDSFF